MLAVGNFVASWLVIGRWRCAEHGKRADRRVIVFFAWRMRQ